MLYHGSQAGAFKLKTIVLESVQAMRRAGGFWEGEQVYFWEGGQVGLWEGGQVGFWEGGLVYFWERGQVGLWEGGQWGSGREGYLVPCRLPPHENKARQRWGRALTRPNTGLSATVQSVPTAVI